MPWTTDKPSKPGFYWYQPPRRRARIVEEAMEDHHGFYIVTTGMRLEDMPSDKIGWAESLTKPPR